MKTMLFNPYTGTPRHPSDISSDPAGVLILDPDEPVRAAQPERKPMTPEQIRAEWDTFIEYPTESRLHVTTTSALLFAEHIARKCIKGTP